MWNTCLCTIWFTLPHSTSQIKSCNWQQLQCLEYYTSDYSLLNLELKSLHTLILVIWDLNKMQCNSLSFPQDRHRAQRKFLGLLHVQFEVIWLDKENNPATLCMNPGHCKNQCWQRFVTQSYTSKEINMKHYPNARLKWSYLVVFYSPTSSSSCVIFE